MNKVVILKILLRDSPCGFLQVPLPEWEAKKLVAQWIGNELTGIVGRTDTAMDGSLAWAFRADNVSAMHTMDMGAMQAEQQLAAQQMGVSGRLQGWR